MHFLIEVLVLELIGRIDAIIQELKDEPEVVVCGRGHAGVRECVLRLQLEIPLRQKLSDLRAHLPANGGILEPSRIYWLVGGKRCSRKE